METIWLIDPNKPSIHGHNGDYMEALLQVRGTKNAECYMQLHRFLTNPLRCFLCLRDFFSLLPQDGAACFLHFDSQYQFPYLLKKIKNRYKFIIGTLHWFPRNKIQQFLLKQSSKVLDYIIVHSDYTKSELESIGIHNVIVIDYPQFVEFPLYKKTTLSEKITFLCLGSTRKDKGADILADSFKYLSTHAVKRAKFIIAGKEYQVPYSYITKRAEKYNICLETYNSIISTTQYYELINSADVILLPYRKKFGGNSGPMTEGIWANKYIIGPDYGNLGYLINKYKLGSTFRIENPKDLANCISNTCLKESLHIESEYKFKLSLDTFIKSYNNLFTSLS